MVFYGDIVNALLVEFNHYQDGAKYSCIKQFSISKHPGVCRRSVFQHKAKLAMLSLYPDKGICVHVFFYKKKVYKKMRLKSSKS